MNQSTAHIDMAGRSPAHRQAAQNCTNVIRLDSHKVLTVDPHPTRPGAVLVHLWNDGMADGFFDLTAKTGSQLVCLVMDGIAATTVPA